MLPTSLKPLAEKWNKSKLLN